MQAKNTVYLNTDIKYIHIFAHAKFIQVYDLQSEMQIFRANCLRIHIFCVVTVVILLWNTTYNSIATKLYMYTYTYRSMPVLWTLKPLTHWSGVTYICDGDRTIIGSDNGLSPGRRQAIICTNAGKVLIGPLGTNFIEILIESLTFSFRKCVWKCLLWNGGHVVSASMCSGFWEVGQHLRVGIKWTQ